MKSYIKRLSDTLTLRPIFGGCVIMVTYFMLESTMMEPDITFPILFMLGATLFAFSFLYITYVFQEYKKNDIKADWYLFIPVIILFIFALLVLFCPVESISYSRSQLITILVLAPIMEELTYRYLVYDKWAKKRFGWFKGMLLVGLIFIITHPITGMSGFVLYWLPTIVLYLTYNEYGLYMSIFIHIVFNIIAIF